LPHCAPPSALSEVIDNPSENGCYDRDADQQVAFVLNIGDTRVFNKEFDRALLPELSMAVRLTVCGLALSYIWIMQRRLDPRRASIHPVLQFFR
jgi:hypothetical protein